ncbi:TnsA endonuclease N-terminal domain-containing protein [Ralstonia sp.]|uniref:TnsA endonuclease N-terminal domain-containing protein n=1 Tax=Ralstonia sp. TaxID=54061 RepID=UPI0031CEC43A
MERDWLIALDFDPSVVSIRVQPFSLQYEDDGRRRRYTPDILAEAILVTGQRVTTVYEVKPREELLSDWHSYRARFKAAVRHCRTQGWRFKIMTERQIRTPYVNNAKFLRRYRTIPEQIHTAQQLEYTLKALGETTPQALLAAAYLTEEKRMAALPELWRLVAARKVGAILTEPLTMRSPIWLPGD